MGNPGWYNDEQDPARARWHDGSRWTEHTIVKAEWPPSRGKPPPPADDDWGTAPGADQPQRYQPPAAPPPPPNRPASRREGRADGKAEKARQKAMRPWYQKKRFLIPIALVVIGGIAAAAGGGDEDDPVATGNGSQESSDPLANVLGVGDTDDTSGIDVTLLTVEAPFRPGEFESGPDPGFRWIGVELSATNTTDEDQVMSSLLNMEIKDDTGQRFDIVLAGMDRPQIDGTILPGDTIRGWTVFNVPTDATGLQLIVRGSLTASGVRFDLGLG